MSLKVKLTSLILGVIFAISMMIVGVLSVSQVNLGIGGNVTFTAKGINCEISEGSLIEGESTAVTKAEGSMLGFTYSTTTAVDTTAETTFKNSWKNLDLVMNSNGDKLTISFTIKNTAGADSGEYIKVTIGSPTFDSKVNMKDIVVEGASTIAPQATEPYKIIFEVDNKTINANIGNFNINYLLETVEYEEPVQTDENGVYEGFTFTKLSEGKASVKATNNTLSGNVNIPSKVILNEEILDVTSIEEGAFAACSGLTNITIPNGVISIGYYAFAACSGLTNITIPNGVISIGYYAFGGCGMTSITISDSVESIEYGAFMVCSELETITVTEGNSKYYSEGNAIIEKETKKLLAGCKNTVIPNGVTSIEAGSFFGCSGLTSITIPKSVEIIGMGAFAECSGLTNIIISENSVTSIEENAFGNCSGLTNITLPYGLVNIGVSAFIECSGLTSVTIPSSVINIGERAFFNCSELASIIIPSSVTSIKSGAFNGCSGLTNITLSYGLENIGELAFNGCSGLTSVTIPSSVRSIEKSAFGNCSNLTDVTFENPVSWFVADSDTATSGTNLSGSELSNPSTAATMLKSTYCYKYWKKLGKHDGGTN